MAFKHLFPYTNFEEINLDYILKTVANLENEFDEFKVINKITFGGTWDITKQYKPWTIVDVENTGYLSVKAVPAGIEITNEDYWVQVANYSALYADLQTRVAALESSTEVIESRVSVLEAETDAFSQYDAIGDGVIHPLSYRYTTLAEAQTKYACATNLNDSIDWCAIQQYIIDCQTNKKDAYILPGKYVINKVITIDNSAYPLSVIGSGVQNTMITSTVSGIYVKGTTSPAKYRTYQTIKGFTLVGTNRANRGISVEQCAYITLEDILCNNFSEGFYFLGVEHSRLVRIHSDNCVTGALAPVVNLGTHTAFNNILFESCIFGGCSNGVDISYGGGNTFLNCSIENNTNAGLIFSNCGYQSGTTADIINTYFENNVAYGSIYCQRTSFELDCRTSLNVIGCTFNFTQGTNQYGITYIGNNLDSLYVTGCSFNKYSGYTEGTARVINYANVVANVIGCYGNMSDQSNNMNVLHINSPAQRTVLELGEDAAITLNTQYSGFIVKNGWCFAQIQFKSADTSAHVLTSNLPKSLYGNYIYFNNYGGSLRLDSNSNVRISSSLGASTSEVIILSYPVKEN